MANEVKTKLSADNSNLNQGLSSGIGAIKNFAGAATAIGASIAVFAVMKKVGKELLELGKESIALFQIQENSEARVEAVLQATGNAAGLTLSQLKAIAEEVQSLTTFGDEIVLDAMSLLLTFKNITGDTVAAATMMAADLSVILKTDLRGAMMQLGKALDDPIKGMTALGKSGVSFSETERQIIRDMVAANDLAGAQGVIMEAIAGQVAGAATRMANTTSGKFLQMQNAIGDMKEEIGGALVRGAFPALERISNEVLDAVGGDFQEVTLWIEAATVVTIDFAEGMTRASIAARGLVEDLVPLIAILNDMEEGAGTSALLAGTLGPVGILIDQWLRAQSDMVDLKREERRLDQELLGLGEKRAKEAIVFATLEEERQNRLGGGTGDSLGLAAGAEVFRSSITSGESLFRRIQSSAASSDPVVGAVEEVVAGIDEQVSAQNETNTIMVTGFTSLEDALRRPAVLGE